MERIVSTSLVIFLETPTDFTIPYDFATTLSSPSAAAASISVDVYIMSIYYQQIARDASELDRESWDQRDITDREILNTTFGFKIEILRMNAGILILQAPEAREN